MTRQMALTAAALLQTSR